MLSQNSTSLQNHFPALACTPRMVEIGSLLSSLPNRPLPVATVEGLEEHDAIVISVAVLTEETSDGPVTNRFALVTNTVGVVLEYVPGDGWTVIEKVSSDGRSPKELILALSVESIKEEIELDDDDVTTVDDSQKGGDQMS